MCDYPNLKVGLDAIKGSDVKASLDRNMGEAKDRVIQAVESTLEDRKKEIQADEEIVRVKKRKQKKNFRTRRPPKKFKSKHVSRIDEIVENSPLALNDNRYQSDIFD